MRDYSQCVWYAATLRSWITGLYERSESAREAQMPDVAAKLEDLALEVAKVYEELIELCSPAKKPAPREQHPGKEGLPF